MSGERSTAGPPADVPGVISAGGQSTRFGSPKALAQVGGIRVMDRVAARLAEVVGRDNVLCIANDPALGEAAGLPWRPDELQNAGALAGVHTALLWARERGAAGALLAGCDMPFLDAGLLREILQHSAGADVVVPSSESRRGVEPLCAWYGTACIGAIEDALSRGDARMVGFHDAVRVHRIPLARVREFGDPAHMFMNINTPADLAAAEALEAR